MTEDKKSIIFSDFDGTITERDVIVMIMENFAPPEWVGIKDKILYKRSITLKDGLEKLFSLIDSSKLLGSKLPSSLAASKVVDIVFARGDLIKYLEQDKIAYIPFNDFHEVKEQLQQKPLQKI